MLFRLALLCGLIAPAVNAQSSGPAFEAASVKVSKQLDVPGTMRIMSLAGRVEIRNQTLRDILAQAYKLKEFQIKGPAWLANERFDISAKKPDGATGDEIRVMLRHLISERFQMVAHFAPAVIPVYELRRKEGPNPMTPATGSDFNFRLSWGYLLADNAPMGAFADTLSAFLDRPVVDRTGLAGAYNFSLRWTPDDLQGPLLAGAIGSSDAAPSLLGNSTAPSLFAALSEQLGLRLRAGKSEMRMLVIERLRRVPVEN